jgi:hypothetical protein
LLRVSLANAEPSKFSTQWLEPQRFPQFFDKRGNMLSEDYDLVRRHRQTRDPDAADLPYQKLIDLYLLDCAKKRKKLTMKWVA